jgi:trehalose-phosphatase
VSEGRIGSPLAVMLDVDGTVAPIAPTPAGAIVPPQTREILRRIVRLPATTLTLVSGRSAADAAQLVQVEGAWIIGNHGFELRNPDGSVDVADGVLPFKQAVADAARELETAPKIPGALIENKGWTISYHYRLVAPPDIPALLQRAKEVASAQGLRLTEGKKLVELRPPVDIHKGTATIELASRLGALERDGCVIYAGDDRTDEDAFRALRSRSRRAITIHIKALPDEHLVPPTLAELTLESPEVLREALDWLVGRRAVALV